MILSFDWRRSARLLHRQLGGSLAIVLLISLVVATNSFTLDRQRFHGVWKLTSEFLPYEQNTTSKLAKLIADDQEDGILIKLNPDGSFEQCNEGYTIARIEGQWELSDGKDLILAMKRQCFGTQFDVILEGSSIQADGQLTIDGHVQKGKFMYPQTHPAFFDQPMINQEPLGPFSLEQTLATESIIEIVEEESIIKHNFQPSMFYDRSFIMTIEPVEPKVQKDTGDPLNLPVDIRAMPIQFFRNNTFQALATNKILRGRFRITKKGKLAFDVSLFGSGRSMPGSVFSEGIGLTHEDKRSYLGSIEESNGRIYVDGSVVFGSDLGSDARPEPVGMFLLTETKNENSIVIDEDDDSVDSVFE